MDAAIAGAVLLGLCEPAMTGIGGDCFVLYAPHGKGSVLAYNGSGRAPGAAAVEWYQEKGIDCIDPHSPHAVTIPGAVDAWARMTEDHGTMGLDKLLPNRAPYAFVDKLIEESFRTPTADPSRPAI